VERLEYAKRRHTKGNFISCLPTHTHTHTKRKNFVVRLRESLEPAVRSRERTKIKNRGIKRECALLVPDRKNRSARASSGTALLRQGSCQRCNLIHATTKNCVYKCVSRRPIEIVLYARNVLTTHATDPPPCINNDVRPRSVNMGPLYGGGAWFLE